MLKATPEKRLGIALPDGPVDPKTRPLPITQPVDPILKKHAHELSSLIKNKELSARELMSKTLEHIEAVNPAFNAIVALQDKEKLLSNADAADEELANGHYRGWMHGLPLAVKDLADTKDIVTTAGYAGLAKNIPNKDEEMVRRMKGQGAIVIGKTNTPEFGLGSHSFNAVYGVTHNAWDQSRSAGGSSGGAAVSLALRMTSIADGSDMMGSLRNPAAWNNVLGFRPSLGRVPAPENAELFTQQLATNGPMARSAKDLALLLETQAGYHPNDPLSLTQEPCFAQKLDADLNGKRAAWLGDWGGALPMESEALAVCEQALEMFSVLGMSVEQPEPLFDAEHIWDSWLKLRHWQVAGKLTAAYNQPELRALMKPEAIWEIEQGHKLDAMALHRAAIDRSSFKRALTEAFETFDYLVLPAAQCLPFDVQQRFPQEIAGQQMDSYHRWMQVVVPASLAGHPAIALPAGFSKNGLPMGLQVICKDKDDLGALQLAHGWSQATDWLDQLPPSLC